MPLRPIKTIAMCLALLAGLGSCANIVRPTGGDRDKEGPKMIGAVPHSGARNFMGREVVFYFDEFIKPGNYAKEIFISPIPVERPEVKVLNKKITVRFRDELRENTTYVITLGKDILDFTEGNKMGTSFTYAFSTGDELDTLQVSGTVASSWGNAPQDEITVMLFPEEELNGDSIFGKKPVYAIETDRKGEFKFQYLREGKYRIFAVRDVDNDFSYSQLKEEIGIAENSLVDLADTASRGKPLKLVTFAIDNQGPQVKSLRWANDQTIHVEFGEEPRENFQDLSLGIAMRDTNGGGQREITQMYFRDGDRKHLYFAAPYSRDGDYEVAFTNLMDSLGQPVDTVVRLPKDLMNKEDKGKLFETPIFQPEGSRLLVQSYLPLEKNLAAGWCEVRDTAGKVLKTIIVGYDFSLQLALAEMPDFKMKYEVVIDTSFRFANGAKPDSVLRFPVTFPDPASYGAVMGTIVGDSTKPGMNYVVIVSGPPITKPTSKKDKARYYLKRLSGPGPFALDHMPAGLYTISVIEDADGNGVLTPGSLFPYRMPEKMVSNIPKLEIKANWTLKNHKINVTGGGGKETKLKGAPAVEDEDNEEVEPEKGNKAGKGKAK